MKHLAYLIADPIISKIQSRNYHKESFYNFLVEYTEGNWKITLFQQYGTNSISFTHAQAYSMHPGVLDEIVRDYVAQTLNKLHEMYQMESRKT